MSLSPPTLLLGFTGAFLKDEIELFAVTATSFAGAFFLNKPELAKAQERRLYSHVAKDGKFPKTKVIYVALAPPPLLYEYTCARCRAYEPETKRCKLVDEWGFPQPGTIEPQAWCSIWMPKESEKPLAWLGRPGMLKTLGPPKFP